MSGTWDNRFDSHPVWGALEELNKHIETLPEALTPEDLDATERIVFLAAQIAEHKDGADTVKALYTQSMLDRLDTTLTNEVNCHLSEYLGDPENKYDDFTSAATCADDAFDILASWPALPKTNQASAAGRAYSQYRKAAESALQLLNESYESLREETDQLRASLSQIQANCGAVEGKVVSSLEGKEEEYSDALRRVEESGREAYEKQLDKIKVEAEDLFKTIDDQAYAQQAVMEETVKTAKGHEVAAKESRESCERSAKWLADRAVATDFGRQARRKSAAAWTYDILAIIVGGVPLGALLVNFLQTHDANGNAVTLSLTRLSITLALLVIAGYLFSRGALNHRQARASKSADIRLGTVEAFISRLSVEEAAAIRRGMAENIYLRGQLAEEEGDHNVGNPLMGLFSRHEKDAKAEAKPDEEAAKPSPEAA